MIRMHNIYPCKTIISKHRSYCVHRKSDAARLRDESGEDIFPEDRVELLKGLSEKADIYER